MDVDRVEAVLHVEVGDGERDDEEEEVEHDGRQRTADQRQSHRRHEEGDGAALPLAQGITFGD